MKMDEQTQQRIKQLIEDNPVMLFMKGTPDAPLCGFSWRVAVLLLEREVDFGYCDVIAEQAVREEIKEYADWPTIPQLYINGSFIGGCEIVEEMAEQGTLDSTLAKIRADPQQ